MTRCEGSSPSTRGCGDPPRRPLVRRILGSPLGQRRLNLFVDVFMKRELGEAWPAVCGAYHGPLAQPQDRQGCALVPRMLCDPWRDEVWQRRGALRDVPRA